MKVRILFCFLILLSVRVQCGGLVTEEISVSFVADIVPVLRFHCATCHMSDDSPGGVKLYPSAAYGSLVGISSMGSDLLRVQPGAPEASYLWHKLKGTHLDVGGSGVSMPFGQALLPVPVLEKFRQWISQGAQNN